MRRFRVACLLTALALLVGGPSLAAESKPMHGGSDGAICEGFGPQTPRDIDQKRGTNTQVFPFAPNREQMNLCNIHFHKSAEHKAAAFARPASAQDGGGFRCTEAPAGARGGDVVCGGVRAGDTIEVHWVYSSCHVAPGKGLGACSSAACANPALRVEAQVFVVVDDGAGLDFRSFDYGGDVVNGFHQPKALPTGTGDPVGFLGSTTGPSFTAETCSPLQVSWSVRPQCAPLEAKSLGDWCEDNAFDEDHAHGVRSLVTDPSLLSTIGE